MKPIIVWKKNVEPRSLVFVFVILPLAYRRLQIYNHESPSYSPLSPVYLPDDEAVEEEEP
jgi:hypothetical protein